MDGALYVTGDKHFPAQIDELHARRFHPDDVLIVLGDEGILLEGGRTKEEIIKNNERNIKKYLRLGCTVLFLPGNHINMKAIPMFDMMGLYNGAVREIVPNIYLLITGNIYDIFDRKIFVFGGAATVRNRSISGKREYFNDTVPTGNDFNQAAERLEAVNNRVDVVLSHDCPSSIAKLLHNSGRVGGDKTKDMLEEIGRHIEYAHWYFGHHHIDANITTRHRCVLNDVIEIRKEVAQVAVADKRA